MTVTRAQLARLARDVAAIRAARAGLPVLLLLEQMDGEPPAEFRARVLAEARSARGRLGRREPIVFAIGEFNDWGTEDGNPEGPRTRPNRPPLHPAAASAAGSQPASPRGSSSRRK